MPVTDSATVGPFLDHLWDTGVLPRDTVPEVSRVDLDDDDATKALPDDVAIEPWRAGGPAPGPATLVSGGTHGPAIAAGRPDRT